MASSIGNIMCGIIGSLLASVIWMLAIRVYIGAKNTRGMKDVVRLIRDTNSSGIINIFPDRKAYIQHKDHGTESQYISDCNNEIMYVGYWLAHGTESGNIVETLKTLIVHGKKVTIILINPENEELIQEVSDYLNINHIEMKQRVIISLAKFYNLKMKLPKDYKENFEIRVHNIPLNASAFMIDYENQEKIRILVDYKIYGEARNESYGIEYRNKNKIITQKLCKAYKNIYSKSDEYEILEKDGGAIC